MPLVSVQILRAVAALLVAIGHAQAFVFLPMQERGADAPYWRALPWGAGVDLFFVISGFIMVHASERLFSAPGGARTFVWRRLARILPLYYAATLLYLAKSLITRRPISDLASVAASFLFIPCDSHGDGALHPIYELGWTLNYEMFFYALFALFLFLPRARAVGAVALALLGLVAFGFAAAPESAPLRFWSRPITLEFAFGMGLALLARRGVSLREPWRWALVALGGAGLFCDFPDAAWGGPPSISPNDLIRVIGWGVPAALILAGCVLRRDRQRGAIALPWRLGRILGDASYALYLCHPIVMSAFAGLWFALGLDRRFPATAAVLACMALSIAAALAVYRWFEKPLTGWLQQQGLRLAADKPPRPRVASV